MSRARPRRRLNLTDPQIAARLDATGIPARLANRFAELDVSVGVIERLALTGLSWDFIEDLSRTSAIETAQDVAALVTFANFGWEEAEVARWARLGALDAGVRLHLKSVPVEVIEAFPLPAEHGLRSLLQMIQSISTTGIHIDDVLLWHTAGVVTLSPPYLVHHEWAKWRSAAVSHLGMRPAALAAAAGLSVTEATEQFLSGEFDTAMLQMLAAMRTGTL